MTIMNVYLERDRAIVSSNTEIRSADGSTGYADKIFPLPHVNCVIAGRGEVNVLLNVYLQAYTLLKDFDGMAELWNILLTHIVTEIYTKPRGDVRPLAAEVVLVGRSKARQEMVCYYAKIEEDGAMELHDVKAGILTPWDGSWGPIPQISPDRTTCVALARQQAALGDKFYPEKCWHGDLTVAEVTLDTTTLSTVREFWKNSVREPEAACA